MRAAALGACLWLGTAAFAQPPDDTVQWNAALSSSAPISPGGIASITVTGTIANGWHVYALEQLPGGPTPLLLSLADSTLASAEGPPSGSKPSTVFDKRFGLKTQFYTGTVGAAARAAHGRAGGRLPAADCEGALPELQCAGVPAAGNGAAVRAIASKRS